MCRNILIFWLKNIGIHFLNYFFWHNFLNEKNWHTKNLDSISCLKYCQLNNKASIIMFFQSIYFLIDNNNLWFEDNEICNLYPLYTSVLCVQWR
jgi:hypothetical protein